MRFGLHGELVLKGDVYVSACQPQPLLFGARALMESGASIDWLSKRIYGYPSEQWLHSKHAPEKIRAMLSNRVQTTAATTASHSHQCSDKPVTMTQADRDSTEQNAAQSKSNPKLSLVAAADFTLGVGHNTLYSVTYPHRYSRPTYWQQQVSVFWHHKFL